MKILSARGKTTCGRGIEAQALSIGRTGHWFRTARVVEDCARHWRLWLVLTLLMRPETLMAQDLPQPPTPGDVTELDAPAITANADENWQGTRSYRQTAYGAPTSWDLYAGSVYANSSPLWVHAEGLLWWMRGNELPALVTTSPNGTARQDAGVLGVAGTSILHGNERVDDRARGGFRTTLGARLGHWFDHLMDSELQFDFLWVGDGQSSGDFHGFSLGDPILARPFLNAASGTQDAQLVGFPNVVWGDLSIQTSSDFLSAGALFRKAWLCGDNARVDWMTGYRYAQLRERLLVEEFLVARDPLGPNPVDTTFDLFDDFRTWNEFHGADMGLQLWTHAHGWTIEVTGKLALGALIRTVEVDGATFVEPPVGSPSLAPGGLLALPTNMGRFQSSRFSVLPEFTIRLRRPISHFFTFTVGYSALVLNNVVRTGDQIDLVVNPSQLGNGALIGAARPTTLMKDSTVWVHGVTLGLEW